MEDLFEWISEPMHAGMVVGGVVALLIIVSTIKKIRRSPKAPKVDSRVKRHLQAGNYEAAAALELKNNNLEQALDYYLQAQNPARAAQVAQRMDRPRQAAELYERAGDAERAIAMYRAAGMDQKADELKRSKPSPSPLDEPMEESRPSEGMLLTPADRARRAESKFLKTRDRAANGDPQASSVLEELGREAAEAMLSAGETRRAAELCEEAGLLDQAINLYVNLLGEPGAAAPLLSKRGDHKRAAELYEAAGKKERAFASWMEWSKKASDPLLHLSEVERLGDDTAYRLLDAVVQQRPLKPNNIDLHYRVVRAYEQRDRVAAAVPILEQIVGLSPQFEDAEQKLAHMRTVLAAAPSIGEPLSDPTQEDLGTANTMLGSEATSDAAGQAKDSLDSDFRATDEPFAIGSAPDTLDGDSITDNTLDAAKPGLDQLVDQSAIEQLVSEVASAAAREATSLAWAKRPSIPAPTVTVPISDHQALHMPRASRPPASRRLSTSQVRGIERIAISLQYVDDPQVVEAKNGPPPMEYTQMIGGNTPDLQNIELFYRLGLSHAAAGQWTDARAAFQAVQEVSPGYRDAGQRADELGRWEDSVPNIVAGQSLVTDAQSQRYKMLGKLGSGGMAVVYRARDEALERDVALKFLSEDISSDEKMLEMFKREARAAAQLNHPNIVTVYDVGILGGRNFICMELVSGTTVEEMLEEAGTRLRVLDALRITESVLGALEYAHSKKIIHRDIKPSNIMRNELSVVKLMDFGLAKSLEGKAKTTMIAGTPNYMPPEQFTGKNMDARSDLFALGASVFEMLTGFPPFDGMVRAEQPTSLRELNPTVPKLLDRMVARSMEFDMDKRYQSAGEMLVPIRRILTSVTAYIDKHTREPGSPIA